jgi:tetratricopeptide (TPR) repeat protein
LFCFLSGSVLGVRWPSVAGATKKTAVAVAALTVGAILWLGAGARMWLPTLFAEESAARGDELFRTSVMKDRTTDLRKLDAAFAAYEEAMREQPINGEYAYKAANILLYKHAPGQLVRQMIDAAIAANPRSGRYFAFKAEHELRQERPDGPEVIRAYQGALGLSPGDVGLRLAYAEALEKLGDKEFAKEQYREALRWDDLLPKDEPKRLMETKRREVEKKI